MTLEHELANSSLRFFLIRAAVQVQEILGCEVKLRHRHGSDTDTELVVSAPSDELTAALWQRLDELRGSRPRRGIDAAISVHQAWG